ncbi:hypothetical protein HRI_000861100 [Hibiscus trionum]|uniref:Uncharacterized protein n=1 Tax=Hibiscus trionum TaxID=183268 RepID=A0A9W7H7N7_HIBTR|nr:hypothetical protein HRI_000861100 [Hibiscus trionum]
MDEKRVSGSYLIISEDKSDSLYPMCFGVSCAFFALRFLVGSEKGDEKWSEFRDEMLQGSAHLMGVACKKKMIRKVKVKVKINFYYFINLTWQMREDDVEMGQVMGQVSEFFVKS